MKLHLFVWVLGLCAASVSGCAAGRPTSYYQLTIPGTITSTVDSNPLPVTLMLGPITSPHLYREDHIVFGSEAERIGVYQYERWVEPPTEMIEDVLLRELRGSGHYRAVYMAGSDVRADFVLRGRLYDFREVTGSKFVGRVTVEMELRDTKSGALVWTHFYTHDEPVGAKTVSAVAASLDQGVQLGVREFEASLDQYISTHPPAVSAAK